jgi:hypothetical protein
VERAGALYLVSQNPRGGSSGAGAPVYHEAELREQLDVLSGEHHYIPTYIGGSPSEETVSQEIRVTTRNDLFEKRKQEHLQGAIGSRNEQPVPVNGLCSFIAVRIVNEDQARG